MLHQTVAKRFVERRKSSFVPTDPQMTVVVLGATKVGKSSLVSQYMWQGFDIDYKPTVEEFHWIEYDHGQDNLFTLQIIDSSGSHDFLAMRQLYYRTGDAFLVVFSADSEDSYTEAKEIVTQLSEVRERVSQRNFLLIRKQKTSIVLVANKIDKRPRWKDKEAHMFAARMGINFAMITATDTEQVARVFKMLMDKLKECSDLPQLSQLKKRRQSMPNSSRGSRVSSFDVEQFKQRESKKICVIS